MNIEIANRLVNLRKNNRLSQEALAEKLGISRQAVSKWERAEASPDTDNLIMLAKIYKVSLDELLRTGDDIAPAKSAELEAAGYFRTEEYHKAEHHKEQYQEEQHHVEENHDQLNYEKQNHQEQIYEEQNHQEQNHQEQNHQEQNHQEQNNQEQNNQEQNHQEQNHQEQNHQEQNHQEQNHQEQNHQEQNHQEQNYQEQNYQEQNCQEQYYTKQYYTEGAGYEDKKFKQEGIHIKDRDGSEVHVGWEGVHVNDNEDGESVHIDKNGVYVKGRKNDGDWIRYCKHFPISPIIVLLYFVLGIFFNAWHPGWMLLMLIPLWESFVKAMKKSNPNIFAYPILAALMYLIGGFFMNAWHPGWVIFLTIPLYYSGVSYIRNLRSEDDKYNDSPNDSE